jgi:hypothetical protein
MNDFGGVREVVHEQLSRNARCADRRFRIQRRPTYLKANVDLAENMATTAISSDALSEIRAALGVDKGSGQDFDDGFGWRPYRLSQGVFAKDPFIDGGREIARIQVSTQILEDVPDRPQTYEALAQFNQKATLSALIYRAPQRSVVSVATANFHEGSRWYIRLLSAAARLQICFAEEVADVLGAAVGGKVAKAGQREHPAEILGLSLDMFVNAGGEKSPFEGSFKDATEIRPSPWLEANGGPTGMTAEVPFFNDIPVSVAIAKGMHCGTGLVQARSNESHPAIGSGLSLALTLPAEFEPDAQAQWTNFLNLWEASNGKEAPLLGSWCVRSGLQFLTFVPSLLARGFERQGLSRMVQDLVLTLAVRARVVKGLWDVHAAKGQ